MGFSLLGRLFGFVSSGGFLADVFALIIGFMLIAGVYIKGRYDANLVCAEKQTAGIEKSVKEYGKLKKKSLQVPDDELDAYLNKWMRD